MIPTIEKRKNFAKQQTWAKRVDELEQACAAFFPKVSVVVLTYNNLHLTRKCLASVEERSFYPNLELIVVDNKSHDGTIEWLEEFAGSRPWVKLVLNAENQGFAGGNNRGLDMGTGEYLIMLNNDTQVTRGWVLDLLRHLWRDPSIGLVGPVTNNIGNEAKIDLTYDGPEELTLEARRYVQTRRRERLITHTVAFFCVAMPRQVYERVGQLDEVFGIGMFEDDDYCRRVEAAGYRVAIAEDVFVHHELSASLDQLGQERRRELFERNKRAYEDKWGPWRPHQYRSADRSNKASRPAL